jgi:hypothetical protein
MSLNPLIHRRVRHSRMLLAGIQADFGLDPRLKHSGVTVLGVASLDPSPIFEGGHEEHEGKKISPQRTQKTQTVGARHAVPPEITFVTFVRFVVNLYFASLCSAPYF